MIMSFTLTMPRNSAWNKQWSGDSHLYAKTRTVLDRKKIRELLTRGAWEYDFGDGWVARVEAKEVTEYQAREILNKSKGFSGYDWMINSIIEHGDIYTKEERHGKT